MTRLCTILSSILLLLLIAVNGYRVSALVKATQPDMEETSKMASEELKAQPEAVAEMEAHLHSLFSDLLQLPLTKQQYFIRHTTELPWQHGDDLFLPPEPFLR